ncbi:hypothetical protein BZB76_0841 [Actinomadura pelletieri DSM 43383]|uniref:Uncharacterized protein n=1 Tax=Actinomadura pelletieri DSM 43383 TaxID=1120940 RepID=A0A495QZU2_9ACTN|nr:hypothetical protein [Actinomadura pelletieri]RKS79376.1 hypothetical protein BZB76_0841 [Actinomadura pelletieri DSM 43383]
MIGRSRVVLEWRTFAGHDAAVQRLELLRVALLPLGWCCVGLYDKQEFRFPVPLLWVYASGAADAVGAAVTVRAMPRQAWGYFEAGNGRDGFVSPCGDVKQAAEALDLLLRHRMSPRSTWV